MEKDKARRKKGRSQRKEKRKKGYTVEEKGRKGRKTRIERTFSESTHEKLMGDGRQQSVTQQSCRHGDASHQLVTESHFTHNALMVVLQVVLSHSRWKQLNKDEFAAS